MRPLRLRRALRRFLTHAQRRPPSGIVMPRFLRLTLSICKEHSMENPDSTIVPSAHRPESSPSTAQKEESCHDP